LNDCVICCIRGGDTVAFDCRRAGAVSCQVNDSVSFNKLCILEGWLYDELSVFDEDILGGRRGLLKLAIARDSLVPVCAYWREIYGPIATHFRLLCPYIGIEATGEVITEDRAVGVMHDRSYAIINQEASKAEAQEKADEWNYGDPFLFWVLILLPRLFDLALPYSSRVEVSLRNYSSNSRRRTQGRSWSGTEGRSEWIWPWGRRDAVFKRIPGRLRSARSHGTRSASCGGSRAASVVSLHRVCQMKEERTASGRNECIRER
jgi:hypothetical protein